MIKRIIFGILATTAIVAGSVAIVRRPHSRPDVILVSIDTLRADHTSAYGYDRDTTPNLKRFAGEGVTFDTSYSVSSTTSPSHASLFTGLYPFAHGVNRNAVAVPEHLQTLAEALKANGYRTAGFVSSFVMNRKFGFAQGFDTYDDEFPTSQGKFRSHIFLGHPVAGGFDRRGNWTTDVALAWVRKALGRSEPYFLFVHYFDPHELYEPFPAFSRKFPPRGDTELDREIAAYDAEIGFADLEVGRLIDSVRKMATGRETLVVITSDHGQGLMEHGDPYHGTDIYECSVRVPLIFDWPGHIPAGRRIAEPVSAVDLMPTILELANIEAADKAFDGRPLTKVLEGSGRGDPSRVVLLQRQYFDNIMERKVPVNGEQFGLRSGNWKYILGPSEKREELFDLSSDPREGVNLRGRSGEVERFSSILRRRITQRARTASSVDITEEEKAQLRAAGYLH